ncbi:glutamyl-tRNA reductase [Halobium salinum]|uniref:Glutamyl-tRNA reductase n=1 Tax=Halobium salinum TaxID=1364940 RepID=A0ABD5P9G1_9EURY|nr:glutamyl-tRNA reductase [Halobium salinum]
MTAGVISSVSVSHRRAGVDEIEAVAPTDERTAVSDLLGRDGVSEAFVLVTCNRVEAYVVSDDAPAGRAALEDFVPLAREDAVERFGHEESIRHLMRVACGLESLVVGEDQIIGQVKTAMAEAGAVGGLGPTLEDALTKAVHVGERARTETAINEGVVSLASAAVELAARETDLDGVTALVVGAGEMGTLAARSLTAAGVGTVLVANRTVPHAEHVAEELATEARAVGLDAAPAAATEADVVITATGAPEYVLDRSALEAAGRTVVVDIAQPRDVAPGVEAVDDVVVHDIDALEAVTDETKAHREAAAREVEALIDDELDRLLDSFKRKRADEAVSAMYEGAERVKSRELETALNKLESQGELTDEQRETVAALADSLVGQLLAAPTKSLRDAAAEDDWSTIHTAMKLFDPEFDRAPEFAPSAVPEDADIPESVVEGFADD